MKYIGAHVSIAGGVENAPRNAAEIGATAFAMFTKNQRQWNSPPLTEESVAAFKENCRKYRFAPGQILPHDGYLINLGNPDPEKRECSIRAFQDEMTRCMFLGLDRLNFHPGSHLKAISETECMRRIAEAVNRVLSETEGVVAVFENTAGQGSNLGYSFAQLGQMLDMIQDRSRAGVCLDTCHAYAAGYDLKTPEGYETAMNEFEKRIGFESLKGVHLNDSKSKLAGHLDRHQSIGRGELGLEPFRRIMTDPRFDGVPMVLETIDETLWPEEIRLLRAMEEKN